MRPPPSASSFRLIHLGSLRQFGASANIVSMRIILSGCESIPLVYSLPPRRLPKVCLCYLFSRLAVCLPRDWPGALADPQNFLPLRAKMYTWVGVLQRGALPGGQSLDPALVQHEGEAAEQMAQEPQSHRRRAGRPLWGGLLGGHQRAVGWAAAAGAGASWGLVPTLLPLSYHSGENFLQIIAIIDCFVIVENYVIISLLHH